MARLTWDNGGYEYGIDRGVFYPSSGDPGEAWNGLTSIVENPIDSEKQIRYVDGIKTMRRRRLDDFSGTIEAYTYPSSFYEHVIIPRRSNSFGLTYRVQTEDTYKIHIVYNVLALTSGFNYTQSENEVFKWEFTTRPLPMPDAGLSAHLIVDAGKAYPSTISDLEDVLYGTESEAPRLPTPEEVLEIFEVNSILRIIDNGDGTFTAIGPDDVITMLDSTTFQIDWPSAVYIDAVSYTIRSL